MRAAVVTLLFFLSGFTGLVYEVIWARYLALLLGSTAHAQVGVLAVFMAGLALGSSWWGARADRSIRPLRLYGFLEVAVAVGAAGFALGFPLWSEVYWSLLAIAPPPHPMAKLVPAATCVLAMAVPTVCMGGTLPVLTKALGWSREGFGRGVAWLYAINSLGAALGAAAAGFVLVPRWGLDAPFFAAAGLNLLVGLVAIGVDRPSAARGAARAAGPSPAGLPETQWIWGYRSLIPMVAAASGAVAMTYEVVWIRLCSLSLGSSTYAFSIMLCAFILGIAAGGLVYTLWAPARRRPLQFFIGASLASVAILLACLPFYERLPFLAARLLWAARQSGWGFAEYQLANLGFWIAVMFPLTFTSGLTFPALAHAAAQVMPGHGRPVGVVLAANTLGTIAGTVFAGLYALPWLGLRGTFLLAAAMTIAVVAALVLADRRRPWFQRAAAASPIVALFVAYLWMVPAWDLRLLVAGEFRRHEGIGPDISFADYRADFAQELLYYRDGATGTVTVEKTAEDVILRVNGKSDASALGDRETQLLMGHLGPLVLGNARRVLVIGYGSGMTVGAIARHPVEAVDVVEISPEVLEAAQWFRPWIHDVTGDDRVRIHIEDARTFLFRTPYQYDLIVSEPSNPWVAGVSNLFTREFFAQARQRLSPRGILLQWFHTYETNDDTVRLVLRAAVEQFPDVRLFQSNHADFFLVASMEPRRLDREATRAAWAHASDLASVGLTQWETVLTLETAQRPSLLALAGDGPVHTDRRPLLDFWAAEAFYAGEEASLLYQARFPSHEGRLLPFDQVPVGAFREWARYAQRYHMLGQRAHIRLLVAWLAREPLDPWLQQVGAEFLRVYSRDFFVMQELVAAVQRDGVTQHDRLAGLFGILKIGPQPVNERFLEMLRPLVLDGAGARRDIGLELELAELYLAAQAFDRAIEILDSSEGLRVMADSAELSRRACIRAQALGGLGRIAEALVALARCQPTDPAERQRVEHQRRLWQMRVTSLPAAAP
ncbi:MAG: spermidine synthase [Candidatus Binatia bacterium]|nr:MAG: spermidine synthase [Candidatus Binatia bacterium]